MNIMLFIPNIGDSLKVFTDDEVNDSVVINFDEYFKPLQVKLYSKLNAKQNLRKVAELLYIFLTTPGKVEKSVEMMFSKYFDNSICHFNVNILNLFDPELQLINTKPMIKSKLKELLAEFRQY